MHILFSIYSLIPIKEALLHEVFFPPSIITYIYIHASYNTAITETSRNMKYNKQEYVSTPPDDLGDVMKFIKLSQF